MRFNFLSIILFLYFLAPLYLMACGGYISYTYAKDEYYNFIDHSFVDGNKSNTIFEYPNSTFGAYNDRKAYYRKRKRELDVQDWAEYLNLSLRDARSMLHLKGELHLIADGMKKRAYSRYKDVLEFIKSEDNISQHNVDTFFTDYIDIDNGFFALRVAHKIIYRLHISKQYTTELNFIAQLEKIDFAHSNTLIWEWIESFKAGALWHKKDRVEAAYLFAKIFANHKSDANIGYFDFKITNDRDWALLLAKANNKEEITLYFFLRAINPKNNKLAELITMTNISPDSIWVKRLLNVVAQKTQYLIFKSYNENEIKRDSFVDAFMHYLRNNQDKQFNKYLLSYFEYIYNHKKIPVNDKKYQALLEYLEQVQNLSSLNEKVLSDKLKQIENRFQDDSIKRSLRLWTINYIRKFYSDNDAKGKLAKYYIVRNQSSHNKHSLFTCGLTLNILDGYVSLAEKVNKNYIESILLGAIDKKLSTRELNSYYSILYTRAGNWGDALKYALKESNHRARNYDTFGAGFSGNNRDKKIDYRWTHEMFLRRVMQINKNLREDPDSVQDNLLMGIAWYNLSAFGNSANFAKICPSNINVDSRERDSLKMSRKYLERALAKTKSKETKAFIYYQLLKVAMSSNILPKEGSTVLASVGALISFDKGQYAEYYHKLQEYNNTEYYREIKQCAYFKYFN